MNNFGIIRKISDKQSAPSQTVSNTLDVQCGGLMMQYNYTNWIVFSELGPTRSLCIAVGHIGVHVVRGKFSQWVHKLHPQLYIMMQDRVNT